MEDFTRAQQLLDQQLQINWPEQLKGILKDAHPSHPKLLGRMSKSKPPCLVLAILSTSFQAAGCKAANVLP